jgi:hypothetical protein
MDRHGVGPPPRPHDGDPRLYGPGVAVTRHGCGLSKGPQVSSVLICRLGDLASAGQQVSPCEARSRESRTLGRQNKVRMWREQEVRVPS